VAEQTKPESAITDEMRASVGVEGAPTLSDVDKTGIRMFARAVGYTDQRFFDEAYAKSKGYRSLLAPPGYLGTGQYNPNATRAGGGPGRGRTGGGLDGGVERKYTGVDICAGDVLSAVGKIVDISERPSRLGMMVITRRETTFTNQNGEVVCRAYNTILTY
jgi:N-terminal half of MaoC dehydratase